MDFITLDMLLTLAGCVLVVAMITEVLKQFFTKLNPLWLNAIVSSIIGIIRIFVVGDLSAAGIITGILNIFVIILAAGGGYDSVKAIVTKKEK